MEGVGEGRGGARKGAAAWRYGCATFTLPAAFRAPRLEPRSAYCSTSTARAVRCGSPAILLGLYHKVRIFDYGMISHTEIILAFRWHRHPNTSIGIQMGGVTTLISDDRFSLRFSGQKRNPKIYWTMAHPLLPQYVAVSRGT